MTLATDITNITEVITGVTGWVTSLMTVFMQPPLVIFVGIGCFVIGWRLVKRVLVKR